MRYVYGEPRPFQHQREGLKRLIANGGTYAFLWEPGVGKTRPVIDYAGALAAAGEGECRVLVVCPKAVVDSWLSQSLAFLGPEVGLWGEVLHGSINDKAKRLKALRTGERLTVAKNQLVALRGSMYGEMLPARTQALPAMAGDVRVTMAVINLEALSSRRAVKPGASKLHSDVLAEAIKAYQPHLLVVDESHRIKSPTSNVSRVLRRASVACPRKVLLTGTPMPHSPLDVWAQWQVLDPMAFSTRGKAWSFSNFTAQYAEMGGYLGKEIKGFVRLDDLERRMSPRSMPLAKRDCLDLPPTTDVILPVHLGPAETAAYAAMKKDLVAQLGTGEVTAANRLAQLLRLRQITSGFTLNDDGDTVDLGTAREDAAISLLEDLLATERRVVVFAWSRRECDRLAARIDRARLHGAKARLITGDTSDANRLAIRQEFGRPPKDERIVLVCQIRAMSIGVNELVTASHAIFLSLSQQRDDLVQAKGRLDRQGQINPVTFWFLCAPGTVDDVILASHRDRSNLEAALLKHIGR